MPEMIQIHTVLGISDERSFEITQEVITTLCETKQIGRGIAELAKAYPAEALFAGMRLMQAVQMNKEAQERPNWQTQNRQQADLN